MFDWSIYDQYQMPNPTIPDLAYLFNYLSSYNSWVVFPMRVDKE